MLEFNRLTAIGDFWRNHLSRANYMHSDAASQGGGWRQGWRGLHLALESDAPDGKDGI